LTKELRRLYMDSEMLITIILNHPVDNTSIKSVFQPSL
jgi:hypothetical protein